MKREHHIPFDKEFLLEKQIAECTARDAADFRRFFDILEHYFHYEAFNLLRKLKLNYSNFDPDSTHEQREDFKGKSDISVFKETLLKVLERGNYVQVNQEIINESFRHADLIGLKLAIDFDDFEDYGLYVRGYHKTREKVKKFFIFRKEIDLEYYDRVMIYLKYKDAKYFKQKNIPIGKLAFDPDCIVLKSFKRVPKNDLETVFPNAIPKMSTTDKLLFWIPGIGGGISLMSTKVVPALISMYSAYKSGEAIDLLDTKTALNQGLIALGVLGAYLFRQYSSFMSKKIRFSKMLSDSLYFKNLGNNSGAFYSLINASEEEELKETILAYAFLSRSQKPLTATELDRKIESWFKMKLDSEFDFDVEDALYKLKNIGLGIEKNGRWEVIPLKKALRRIDEIWDGAFKYSSERENDGENSKLKPTLKEIE